MGKLRASNCLLDKSDSCAEEYDWTGCSGVKNRNPSTAGKRNCRKSPAKERGFFRPAQFIIDFAILPFGTIFLALGFTLRSFLKVIGN